MIATPTPTTTTTTAGVTTSVSTTHSGQINSIIHCPLTNNCTNIDPHITTTTPVHNDKSQRVDNLHSDTVKPSASGMNDAEDKSSTGTSIRLTTTISNNTMCKSSTGGFNNNNKDQGKPLEMSNALVCDPTKLCAKCRENVCLLSGDFKQILLSTKNQTDRQVSSGVGESDSKVDNNNNKSGDTSASNKVKEIELTIEKYEQHIKYLFDHIDNTKEKCCQTVTSSNSDVSDDNNTSNQNSNINNNRLWDAFNTLTPNHEDVIRPSHNEVNTFHVDDEIDYEERANEVNQVYEGGKLMIIKKDINNNNNNDSNINQHSNCHSMNRLMINHNGDDIDEEKRIITIYRKLHNLRCQIESFSYLSWLGLTSEPPTNKVLVPGSNAPAPNPQMHLIRRSDADSRRNIQEFRRLCKEPVSQEDLLELRSSTFNNWSRTDAQLMRLVREMFKELGFIDHYKLQYHRLDLWLSDIYRRYNRIPFHNYKHAFMVTQMCYVLLWGGKLTKLLDIDDQLTLIMSAICHDLDHPGFNNAYQINAGTVLAMRYNDQSPLENHHSAVAFDLLSHAEVDPFAHLPLNVRQRIRKGMIRCILATDMSRHNEILDEFNRLVVSDLQAAWEIDANSKKPAWVTNKTHKDLVMMIILKISDISNEARPLSVAGPWINRLLAEFFNQAI
uniref:Phosphodiesterase n=1 Tax=Trichobilharzia regenti TaxID=157069 RepID=A0AA85K5Q5_TRIRE|nr:unnamed protein product [Trichobilharzia regenti]